MTERTKISDEERLARIRLNSAVCMRTGWIMRLLKLYGSAKYLLTAEPEELSREGGVSVETAARLKEESKKIDAEKELKLAAEMGASVLVPEDGGFPELLKEIPDAPLLIYVLGKIVCDPPSVALVGTRRPTVYGRRMAAKISSDLARAGFIVVSGLARGIDTVCHESALNARGITWAVVGTGLLKCYPAENKRLAEKIKEGGGAVISEFPLAVGPAPMHFPRRNRIIAGLSYTTVVVEGGIQSGALITAKCALEQGREVAAVPGPADSLTSKGPHRLIKDGAAIAENALDIISCVPVKTMFGIKLDMLCDESETGRAGQASFSGGGEGKPKIAAPAGVNPDCAQALDCIGHEELYTDEIIGRLGWTVQRAAGVLFELEAMNLISSSGGKYSKK